MPLLDVLNLISLLLAIATIWFAVTLRQPIAVCVTNRPARRAAAQPTPRRQGP